MIPRVVSVSGSSTTSISVCASMRSSPSAPEKQATSGSDFGLALQPATLKPSALSLATASLPITPNPSTPIWTSLALGWVVVARPNARALLTLVSAQLSQMDERMHDDPFAHTGGEIGVDHACDRLIREGRIGEEMIHAGAERENHAKIGKVFERAWRMAPTQRVADGFPVERLAQHHDLMGRQQRFHSRPPGVGIPA